MPDHMNEETLRDEGQESEDTTSAAHSIKLLIVDDEEIMRTFLNEVLREEGYEIQLAASGREAVDLLSASTFDVVLTDIVMPELDGLGVVAATKELPYEVDVIVMTGYASMETAVESMKLGAVDYITKPFNIDQIRIIVANRVKERRLRRQAAEGEFYKELSRRDGLTDLYNHRFFHQILETEVSRAECGDDVFLTDHVGERLRTPLPGEYDVGHAFSPFLVDQGMLFLRSETPTRIHSDPRNGSVDQQLARVKLPHGTSCYRLTAAAFRP